MEPGFGLGFRFSSKIMADLRLTYCVIRRNDLSLQPRIAFAAHFVSLSVWQALQAFGIFIVSGFNRRDEMEIVGRDERPAGKLRQDLGHVTGDAFAARASAAEISARAADLAEHLSAELGEGSASIPPVSPQFAFAEASC